MNAIVSARAMLALPLLLLAGTALAQGEPQWLKDARAREGKDLKEQALKSKDGYINARTRGKVLNEIVGEEGSYSIAIDIGADTPANCEVIVDGFDLAGILRATADITFKEVEPVQGKIDARAVERTDAGVFGVSPYLAVDWIYRVNSEKGPLLGSLKQIAVMKNGHGLYCAHVDLGYSKSFFDAAKLLVETIAFSEEAPSPYYSEIAVAALAGARIGVVTATVERDEEGDSKMVSSTSLLLRVTPDSLSTQDTSHVQWVRPDGSLINATHVVSNNNELDANLQLQADEEVWLVSGEFKGKSIEQKIASTAPVTWLQQAQARRGMFGQKDVVGKQLSEAQWTIVDPTRFIETQTTVLSVIDAGHLSARETIGGMTAEHVLDKVTGMPSKTVMHVGPQTIEIERVFVQGSF
jgi:hypothetical protein